MALVLDPRVSLSVLARSHGERERHEELGCGLQGPGSRPVRRALSGLRARIRRLGRAGSISRAEELVRWLDEQPGYRALCDGSRRLAGRRVLKQSVLFPDPRRQQPELLHVRYGLSALEVELPGAAWPAAADAFAAIAAGEPESALAGPSRRPELSGLFSSLRSAGLLVDGEPPERPAASDLAGGVLFVGHNTAVVASRTTRVLVDPWLRPWHDQDPPDYRPLLPAQLLPVDAVCITHSHGDHFHLGSLLHLPRSTPILVPTVERETVLATDLAFRLRQLGFTGVRQVGWGDELRFGDVTVDVLPFYGEQPTTTELVYPEIRNAGNCYVIRTPQLAAAFLADTGRDRLGDMAQVALAGRRARGKVDLLFTGTRAFRAHPVLYPFSSLDAYLLNVPLELAGVSQQLMCDSDDALDVAEAFGARFLVPYADGGAPWYWREGMGPSYRGYPAYDGFRNAATEASDDVRSDPFPERVAERAAFRYGGPGPVSALCLRPGDLVRLRRGRAEVRRFAGHGWPYGDGESIRSESGSR